MSPMSPMRGGLAAAAMLATGCFSVPPYEPETRVSYTEAATGGTATGPGFALRFASVDGFHFPDALMIDGADVMGHEVTTECDAHDAVGVLLSPTKRISASGDAERVMNQLVPVLRGPAVVQVQLAWATSFTCNLMRTPGGTSTFTVFPDGRIVRYDTITDPSKMPISPSLCSCGPQGKLFEISPFWTFTRGSNSLYASEDGPFDLPMPGEEVHSNYFSACLDGGEGAYKVALAWDNFQGTRMRGGNALIGFDRLLKQDSSLEDIELDSNSAIFIGHTNCMAKETVARTKEYLDPSPLSVDGAPGIKPSIHNGIYGGDGGSDGKPGIKLATAQTVLSGPVTASFAVWLRFPRSVDALRAKAGGMTGPWYLPQRVDDDSWIIWFREAISANQPITVEAL
jgi:hypothetical protein